MEISHEQSCKSELQIEKSTLCGSRAPQILSRRKFTELHINLKLALITDAELNQFSQRSLADKYNVSKTAVQRILQQKDEIRKFADTPQTLKRKRQMVYSDIDLHVQKWYECCKRKKIPISGPRLQNKALEIAKTLQIEEFTASNGWLNRFKKRHVPSMKNLETNDEAVQEWFSKVSQLYHGHSPENIYNFDECSIYQRNIFPKTAGRSIDKSSGKERLTVCFLCSLVHKENPLVIGRNKNPNCFKNIDIESEYNITWRSDVYGGLSYEIFEEYLIKFDENLKIQNRNVILFLNNTITCHLDLQFKLSNIKLEFVPGTISDQVQPLYLGIIKAFKRSYKIEAIKNLSNDNETLIDEDVVKKISLLDACNWISKSWQSLSTLLIQSSFKKAGLLENSIIFYESPLDDIFSSSSEEEENFTACTTEPIQTEPEEIAFQNVSFQFYHHLEKTKKRVKKKNISFSSPSHQIALSQLIKINQLAQDCHYEKLALHLSESIVELKKVIQNRKQTKITDFFGTQSAKKRQIRIIRAEKLNQIEIVN